MNEAEQLASHCTRFLSHNSPKTYQPAAVLAELAALAGEQFADNYATGEIIESFEAEVASLVGKEAAVFMPSGTMAQQIALRIWTDRRGTKNVAFHPTCHLELHEQKAYQHLHRLQAILVGDENALMTLNDLLKVHEPLGALLLELPQREIGGQLLAWDDLQALTTWAREKGIPIHLDGARLWECGPFYGRPYAEIAALFDSLYVSFYKGLGGISGAALAGPADLIAEARIWLRRHGGNLIRLYPFVLSARQGLQRYLPRMEAYHRRAVEVARVLSSFEQMQVVPNPPATNMMHVYLRGDRQRLENASREIAEEQRTFLFYRLASSALPGYQKLEVTIRECALEFSDEEIRAAFEDLFRRVNA